MSEQCAAWRPYLLWGEALHIGGAEDVLQVLTQLSDVGVHSHLKGRRRKLNTALYCSEPCYRGLLSKKTCWRALKMR